MKTKILYIAAISIALFFTSSCSKIPIRYKTQDFNSIMYVHGDSLKDLKELRKQKYIREFEINKENIEIYKVFDLKYNLILEDRIKRKDSIDISQKLERDSAYYISEEDYSFVESQEITLYYESGEKGRKYFSSKYNVLDSINSYYQNGNIEKKLYFDENGYLHGNILKFWENGKMKKVDVYKNGIHAESNCYNIKGNFAFCKDYDTLPFRSITKFRKILSSPSFIKEEIIHLTEEVPSFDLAKFSQLIIYPKSLFENEIQETVIAKILVAKNGKARKFAYDNNHSKEFVDEIYRVLMEIDFEPGKVNGEPISCWIAVPITFRIDADNELSPKKEIKKKYDPYKAKPRQAHRRIGKRKSD